MNVTFETVICAWDEKIPALLIRLVNTLLFCRTEEELRQSIDKLRETTDWIMAPVAGMERLLAM